MNRFEAEHNVLKYHGAVLDNCTYPTDDFYIDRNYNKGEVDFSDEEVSMMVKIAKKLFTSNLKRRNYLETKF